MTDCFVLHQQKSYVKGKSYHKIALRTAQYCCGSVSPQKVNLHKKDEKYECKSFSGGRVNAEVAMKHSVIST